MIRFFLWHNIFREKTDGFFTTRCSAIFRRCSFFSIYGYPSFYLLFHPYFAVIKTYLRNIHCPTDMSENFHICCRFARPGPTPSSISGIACSVCTVDLASCSNVMQCKENFYSLAGLPLDFPERIHLAPSVSQAKDFLYFIVGF